MDQVTINVKLPDTITIGMWEVYTSARQKYIADCEKEKRSSNMLTSQYHGSLALIKAGYVKLEGLDKLVPILERTDQNSIELSVMGFIVRNIALKVEQELDAPLASIYLPPSSHTEKTPSETTALKR